MLAWVWALEGYTQDGRCPQGAEDWRNTLKRFYDHELARNEHEYRVEGSAVGWLVSHGEANAEARAGAGCLSM